MSEAAAGALILLAALWAAGMEIHQFYALLGLLLTPFAFLYYLLLSLAKQINLLADLKDRFGFFKLSAPRGSLWIHGASVGEVQLAGKILAALDPDGALPAVVSAVTAAGLQRAGSLGPRVRAVLHPLDLPFAAARAVRRIRPRLLVLVEGDYWLLSLLHARLLGARIVVVNARVSERAFPRMRAAGAYYRACFRLIDEFLPRSEGDRARLIALGAKPAQLGPVADLKFDLGEPPPSPLPAGGPLFVAGSLYEPEFATVLAAFAEARRRTPALRLLLAPRRREEFPAAWRALQAAAAAGGWRAARRSEIPAGAPWPEFDACLLDSFGELAGVYRGAALAFAGGSLFRHGGQNPLEAAAAGVPVLYGPSMENFSRAVEQLHAAGAGIAVDRATLAPTLCGLLEHPDRLAAAGARARALIDANRGVTAIVAARLREWWETALAAGPALPAPPRGPLPAWLAWPLLPAGVLWRWLLALNAARPRAGAVLSAPVVSVGNLSLGGTGKTPLTLELAAAQQRAGRTVAILSRGYGRADGEPRLVRGGEASPPDPARIGDEPALFASRLPGAWIAVAADRRRAATLAEPKAPDLYLLDDGFQHRRVARDLDLCLLDPAAPLSTGAPLPGGLLREPLSALDRADLQLFPARAPGPLRALAGGPEIAPADCPRPLAAWCAIARPDAFFALLEGRGLVPVRRAAARDHHRPDRAAWEAECAAAAAAGARAIVVTEKDAVKLRPLAAESPFPLPVLVQEMALALGPADARRLREALARAGL